MVAQTAPAIARDRHRSKDINLGSNERWISSVVGGALFILGLNRLSIPAMVLTGVGAALLYRGASGYCPLTVDHPTESGDGRHLMEADEERGGQSPPVRTGTAKSARRS